eukprot:CAMPEP_0176379576 /NCGR_PEP_ID=MMETSP0126-20121128/30457_1 /TAXON_ID=141414 ORGANISM="Strombidinopsis acuminatum, Strain SPMC142" /NCGR_SAMPLE_ID=MMETSP0126 /ASSEMBLY_ACC=CAM_ASM_000229 /LENGTH=64 /DNA_ID=CAMNT_0017742413 /DNA_START=560 /DNA_END=754 /DNA_ORIENTATION=+
MDKVKKSGQMAQSLQEIIKEAKSKARGISNGLIIVVMKANLKTTISKDSVLIPGETNVNTKEIG